MQRAVLKGRRWYEEVLEERNEIGTEEEEDCG